MTELDKPENLFLKIAFEEYALAMIEGKEPDLFIEAAKKPEQVNLI